MKPNIESIAQEGVLKLSYETIRTKNGSGVELYILIGNQCDDRLIISEEIIKEIPAGMSVTYMINTAIKEYLSKFEDSSSDK